MTCRCDCCQKWEGRVTKLENLLFDARDEVRKRLVALKIRELVLDDVAEENTRLREVMLELAFINDPETKERIARRVLCEVKDQ